MLISGSIEEHIDTIITFPLRPFLIANRMSVMSTFALAFPLLFVFHDLEEIIGMRRFVSRNADMLRSRFPFLYKRLKDCSTEGFALAVMEELVVFSAIAIAAIFFDNALCWDVWFGAFSGLTAHYVVHILQSAVVRMYIPAVLTSIICLPLSILILLHCASLLVLNPWHVSLGLFIVALNMLPALKIAGMKSKP